MRTKAISPSGLRAWGLKQLGVQHTTHYLMLNKFTIEKFGKLKHIHGKKTYIEGADENGKIIIFTKACSKNTGRVVT